MGSDDDVTAGSGELASLARELSVLGSEPRLQLLRLLGRPRPASQLAVAMRMPEKDATAHLDILAAAGVIMRQAGTSGGTEYVLPSQKLFTLQESLAKISPPDEDDDDLTQTRAAVKMSRGASAMLSLGPALIVAHGPKPGAVHRLSGKGPWTLGRDPGSTIPMEYDGYASSKHAEVQAKGKDHVLADVGSRNGTFLNWERLGRGAQVTLTPGDVIGVGKTLLVYRVPP